MDLVELKQLMAELETLPNHKLGQVFLIDDRVVRNQVSFGELTSTDIVLEVGPGLGVLTQVLAQFAGKVIAIEFDKKLFNFLKKTVPDNVELIFGDAIKTDFPKFNKIIANIPYQISSPLIFKLTQYNFDLAIFMLQAEFALRLFTPEYIDSINQKDSRNLTKLLKINSKTRIKYYSRLTVMASYYYDIEFLLPVSKACFWPIPKVDSALIKLTPKREPVRAKNDELFSNLVRVLFSERRKMIRNSIMNNFNGLLPNLSELNKYDRKKLIEHLPNIQKRPEELRLVEFIELSDKLYELILT